MRIYYVLVLGLHQLHPLTFDPFGGEHLSNHDRDGNIICACYTWRTGGFSFL